MIEQTHRDAIEKKMKVVHERVERLTRLAREVSSFAEYQASQGAKDQVERNLQVALEACLDIAKMIIAVEGLQEPKDNKGLFLSLAEARIVTQPTLSFLMPMAGMRNILVHSYDTVDDALMYGVLVKHLRDFNLFLKEINENYLHATEAS